MCYSSWWPRASIGIVESILDRPGGSVLNSGDRYLLLAWFEHQTRESFPSELIAQIETVGEWHEWAQVIWDRISSESR